MQESLDRAEGQALLCQTNTSSLPGGKEGRLAKSTRQAGAGQTHQPAAGGFQLKNWLLETISSPKQPPQMT